jgi:hypothetical protein
MTFLVQGIIFLLFFGSRYQIPLTPLFFGSKYQISLFFGSKYQISLFFWFKVSNFVVFWFRVSILVVFWFKVSLFQCFFGSGHQILPFHDQKSSGEAGCRSIGEGGSRSEGGRSIEEGDCCHRHIQQELRRQ